MISDIERKTEFVYLIARVVNIKFAADIIARKIHNGGKAVAERAASCVAHMHRARGIGGNKFDIDFFACTVIRAAVVRALFENILNDAGVEAVFEIKIHKAGACNLASVKKCVRKKEPVGDGLSNFSRSAFKVSCPSHGSV